MVVPSEPLTSKQLPDTMMDTLLTKYAEAFARLHANRRAGHTSPHKPVMLLAVLSLADNGRLPVNRIEYGPELLELFREYFDIVKTPADQCNPLLPFFFLRGDGFWHHQPLPGQEKIYKTMDGPCGGALLGRIVAYAHLDGDLFQLVANRAAREVLRNALIGRYFPSHREPILALCRQEGEIGAYREVLEKGTGPDEVREQRVRYGEHVRSAGFRRTVTSAYDYRCAACGFRVIMEDLVLVDAAHLIPFNESQDDDPQNGIALCKNHHWAMDGLLIAPGPDSKWHVSEALDDRVEGQLDLLKLNCRKILLPSEVKYHPKNEALEWRMQHLRQSA